MDSTDLELLKACKLFAPLQEPDWHYLIANISSINLKPQEILFHTGDSADALYILIEGKLAAILINALNEKKIVGVLEAGETVGELGALTHEQRTINVEALEASKLFRLSGEVFKTICEQHPAIIFSTLELISHRSRRMVRLLADHHPVQHILLMPLVATPRYRTFKQTLLQAVRHNPSIGVLDEDSLIGAGNLDYFKLLEQLQHLEREKTILLYFPRSTQSVLFRAANSKINQCYLMADTALLGAFDEHTYANYREILPQRPPCSLILINSAKITAPREDELPNIKQFLACHYVNVESAADCARMVRYLSGKAIGLVLSGGGGKGAIHLGVIKAILEAGLSIDAIGGTSIGAVIAGLYTQQQNYEGLYTLFIDLMASIKKSASWRGLTWPAISIFSCKQFTDGLRKLFGAQDIEALRLPFFCISCNLSQYNEVIHRAGPLWQKLRASMALPGLIPPMLIDGEMHVDGGIMNNLPVDIMRTLVGKQGLVIAVDISGEKNEIKHYSFPPALTFIDTLLAKVGVNKNNYHFPYFVDTFLKALLLGSVARTRKNALDADILVAPATEYFRLIGFTKNYEKLITLGYNTARAQIAQWQASKESMIF